MSGVFRFGFNAFRMQHPIILTGRRMFCQLIPKTSGSAVSLSKIPLLSSIQRSIQNIPNRSCSTKQQQQQNDEEGSGQKQGGSFGPFLFLFLFLAAGGSAIAYNYGYFDSKKPSILSKAKKQKKKVPLLPKDIPSEVPYLLIGGGTASFAAFRAIKSHEPKAKVMVITNEHEMPYMRPPLSKEIWFDSSSDSAKQTSTTEKRLMFKQWNGVERSIFYEPDDFYVDPKSLLESPNGGVTIVRGYKVKQVDVNGKKAILEDGTEIKYEKCLIATGSTPKQLAVFSNPAMKSKISSFKTVADFEALIDSLEKTKSVAIVGGGFLGSEMACALAKFGASRGMKVHQIFHEKGNMGRVIPEYLSGWTMERVREEGVIVHPECDVKTAELVGKQVVLGLSNGEKVQADHVIVAAGSEPNTELAESSKLEVDPNIGGFIVNSEMLARNNVYVAGDVSNFYDPHLGRRRVEHHDHAVVSGRLAGENMVGLNKPYTHQSMFWSDLGPKVGYEAIGIIDSSLKTVAIFAKAGEKVDSDNNKPQMLEVQGNAEVKQPEVVKQDAELKAAQPAGDDYTKGVVFYLRGDRIVGILLWNVFNRITIARKVIAAEDIRTKDLNEVAKLFNIHDGQQE